MVRGSTYGAIILYLHFYYKGDCPRLDGGNLRPPICPATFLKRCLRALQGAPSEVPRGTDRGDR
jgi:hypothetical protein